MKNTEKEYLESYDKKGCLALIFGMLAIALMLSVCLNLVLWMKISCSHV